MYKFKERVELNPDKAEGGTCWEIWAHAQRKRGGTEYYCVAQEGEVEKCEAEDGLPAYSVFKFTICVDWRATPVRQEVLRKSAKSWEEFLAVAVPQVRAQVQERIIDAYPTLVPR